MRTVVFAAAALLVAGCTIKPQRVQRADEPTAKSGNAYAPSEDETSKIHKSAEDARARNLAEAKKLAGVKPTDAPEVVAQAVRRAFELGLPEEVDALLAVVSFDRNENVTIATKFHEDSVAGGHVEITVTPKPDVAGPVVVAFPPGTYGVAELWPDVTQAPGRAATQDVAFLSAPVTIVPEKGQAVLTVPIACASFERGPPVEGQTFTLQRFAPSSSMERLLVEIARAGLGSGGFVRRGDRVSSHLDGRPTEAVAQLAVWIVREDISYASFSRERRLITFSARQPVNVQSAAGAAKLMVAAGLDPLSFRFYAPSG